MTTGQTRFFCRCGRLLTVDAATRDVTCPTCCERSVVPHVGAGAPPAPASGPAAAPVASPPRSTGSIATAVLGPRETHRVGPFELRSMLGQGGMGSVWRALDTRSGGEVALKLLHPGLQSRPDFISRFQREARAAAALHHPNIVKVIDAGVDGTTPWIAMELVEGEDLLAAAQRGVLRPDNIVPIALQAVRGLLAAAELGITHRDIKPGNVLLTAAGTVKVADFGLAKAVDSQSRVTVTGEILGTPHYMAPEQGRGDRVDHRADLYAFGATLYHVLGGAPPHEAESPVAVIMKHLREDPLPLRTRNAAVAPGLERIVHRLLQKEPEQRYQTHAALIEDLERVAAGNDPIGGADPPLRRVQHGGTTYMLPHEATTEFVLEPAGVWRRGFAFLIDLLAIEFLSHLLLVAGSVLVGAPTLAGSLAARLMAPELPVGAPTQAMALALATVGAALLYYVAADVRGGRTIGRQWLRLRLCRRDGSDLGVLRAATRTLLVAPGVLLLAPALSHCVAHVASESGWLTATPSFQSFSGVGIAWLLVLELLGRMSAFRRPLHDGLVGALCFTAQRPRPFLSAPPGIGVPPNPGRALRWSIVPGAGLIYAGRPMLGIAFLAGTLTLFASDESQLALAAWVVATVLAHKTARRRRDEFGLHEAATARLAPPPPSIRRQES
ncbi:MAG: hypothetical protein EXS13_08405 [Planctomycetes bacterium]|nr:hypothetical protein [Planctomycetota bacterium]